MRVLALFEGSYPNGMAMSNRLHLYCRGILQASLSIRVLALRPTRFDKESFGMHEDVQYECISDKMYSSSFLRRRVQGYADFVEILRKLIKTSNDFDILWIIRFSWVQRLFLIIVCRMLSKKVIIELNENPYAEGGSFLSSIHLLSRFNRWCTLRFVFPMLDGFVVISEELKKLAAAHKKASSRIIKVPILVDPLTKVTKDEQIPDSVIGHPYMIHAGALSEKKDGILQVIKAFLKAAEAMPEKKIFFILTESLAQRSLTREIYSLLNEAGAVDQVVFTGRLSSEQLHSLIKNSSLAVINKPYNDQNLFNFPTKLADYLISGVPVIATRIGEMALYLHDNKNALLSYPDDVDDIARKIVMLLQDRNKAERLARSGYEMACREFDYRLHGHRLREFFFTLN